MKQLCLLVLALLVGAALATSTHAVSYTWVGPTGSWSGAANWDPNTGTPGGGVGDYAYVNTGTCTLDSVPANPIQRLFVSSAAGTGVLSIVDGANLQVGVTGENSAYVYSGSAAGASGAIYQSGGTVTLAKTGTGTMRMANNATGYGYYGLSGSSGTTLSTVGASMVAALGAGLFEQTGGTVTLAGSIYITNGSAAWGVYDLSAGSASANSANGGFLMARAGGNATVNVRGTGSLSAKHSIQINQTGGAGIVNLGAVGVGGGTITAYTLQSPTAGGVLNFHGGTLKAGPTFAEIIAGTTPDSDFITSDVTAYVYGEGAIIDTDGNDAVVNADLITPSGSGLSSIAVANGGSGYVAPPIVKITGGGTGATAVAQMSNGVVTGITITNPGIGYSADSLPTVTLEGGGGSGYAIGEIGVAANGSGGLRKLGLGTLTLAGNNNYTGNTVVEVGGLSVTGSLASDVEVRAGALLKGTGAVGDVLAAAGSTVAPGTSIGALTVNGNATLAGTFDVEYDSTTDAIDMLTVTGQLDLSGGILRFSDLAATPISLDQSAYVFGTYGTLASGRPTLQGLPTGYTVDYAYGESGNQIALVFIPEPSSWGLLLLIGLILAVRRRR